MIKLTLDRALRQRNMTRYQLAKISGIQYPIVDKYYKNQVVRYDGYVLDRICAALDCDISDIIQYTKEEA